MKKVERIRNEAARFFVKPSQNETHQCDDEEADYTIGSLAKQRGNARRARERSSLGKKVERTAGKVLH